MAFLQVNNIVKNFGSTKVLKDISFSMEKGEVLAIIGSSGSGKTTLLRCLNFLEKATSGSIEIDGKTILKDGDKLSDKQIRENRLHFGLVFQNFNLFPQYTAFENITLAPKLSIKSGENTRLGEKHDVEENAEKLLRKVGLSNKRDFYPCQLSGGQQQRVAIARALAMSPDILCFDEPTSALDPELTGEVLNVIKGLKSSDSTMIIVTHEMNFARNVADKIIFMADGIVEEMGTPQQVFDNPKSEKMKSFLAKSLENI
ncbi:MAG: amino acid ABC transporter ATP-binding protein [Clostridia bacterium]|nr:amino acid ABC transporter ATP-binding protein [Clostridia bacterium]